MARKERILIIEDDSPFREAVKESLTTQNYIVFESQSFQSALKILKQKRFDLILLDLSLPDGNGLQILQSLPEYMRNRVIIVSGTGNINVAVEAIKNGAYDFIEKPIEPETLHTIIKKSIEVNRQLDDFHILKKEVSKSSDFEKIIFRSQVMKDLIIRANKFAELNNAIFIQGETGTGKELFAQAIFKNSNRKNHPFIPINCSTITESVAEAQLFGYKKGAFTDAHSDYPGKFGLADKGTIFLDEIGDMPLNIQAQCLRILESGEIFPLNSKQPINIDIRVISASNRILEKMVESGNFRTDLLYRIKQNTIEIPPLRERKEDILLLAEHFIKIANIANSKKIHRFEKNAQEYLLRYDWPGNVRELKNVIFEISAITSSSIISSKYLPERILRLPNDNIRDSKPIKLKDLEKIHVEMILKNTNYNIKKTSNLLGISRPALYSKIKKHEINLQRKIHS